MFDGIVPEQFHLFISSLPLSFNPPVFDCPQFQYQQQQLQLHPQFQSVQQQEQEAKREDKLLSTEAASDHHNNNNHPPPWSRDEVLSLLRIRSGMDTNWFPDFSNWDHVSRKLGELGFERSGEECKQKYEEESTHLMMSYNSNNINELEKLCHSENPDPKVPDEHDHKLHEKEEVEQPQQDKKRKRHGDDEHYQQKLEMLKSLCEEVVNKMMSLQEDLHSKILQEMKKRDSEKIAREEAWKKQDMERFEKEFQIRAHQQAIAGDRHTKLIHFLNNFTTSQKPNLTMTASDQEHNPSPTINQNLLMTSSSTESLSSSQNPVKQKPQKPSGRDSCDGIGKRWPKDQVLALISLRCRIVVSGGGTSSGGGHDGQGKELLGGAKGPLWERISQGMLEMGYKRSAKRCKEKWENINKYFRKTKDNNSNKKRSVDSRTCPYFHQLDTLYSQGKLVIPPLETGKLLPR